MASTTFPPMPAASMSASAPTPERSPSRASDAGGVRSAPPRYPNAKQLLINADCGGSNGARLRLWKRELQVLADELGIEITVCHVPPGTSKWNKIEHRLFSFITQNWRGKPLISYLVIVQLIASTTTDTGLTVACRLDEQTMRRASRSPMPRWPPSTSNPPIFTANGTTPSPRGGQTSDAIILAHALIAAPARSQRSGRTPSTAQSQASEAPM